MYELLHTLSHSFEFAGMEGEKVVATATNALFGVQLAYMGCGFVVAKTVWLGHVVRKVHKSRKAKKALVRARAREEAARYSF